jgi:hypothetical protein
VVVRESGGMRCGDIEPPPRTGPSYSYDYGHGYRRGHRNDYRRPQYGGGPCCVVM